MSDRELLELAAKAAGYVTPFLAPNYDGKFCIVTDDGWQEWNPLTDDGDALRLAVKLGLIVNANTHGYSADGVSFMAQAGARHRYASTRRAIVRAASAQGELV